MTSISVLSPWLGALLLVAATAPLLHIAERLNRQADGSSGSDRASHATDLTYLAAQLLYLPACAVVIGRVCALIAAHGVARTLLLQVSPAMGAAIAFVAAEIIAFATHRAMHSVDRLWRLHAIHHSSRHLTWASAYRFHPLDAVTEQLLPLLGVAALGFGPGELIPWSVAATVVVLYAHADVGSEPWWLSHLVVTPRYHRAHHIREQDGRNFALVLPALDVLFRTASFDVTEGDFGNATSVPATGFWRQFRWALISG
jgi:sterol desaturase/sphingolipid hydroxylase (fatty acid hydroxylase superfamily)